MTLWNKLNIAFEIRIRLGRRPWQFPSEFYCSVLHNHVFLQLCLVQFDDPCKVKETKYQHVLLSRNTFLNMLLDGFVTIFGSNFKKRDFRFPLHGTGYVVCVSTRILHELHTVRLKNSLAGRETTHAPTNKQHLFISVFEGELFVTFLCMGNTRTSFLSRY